MGFSRKKLKPPVEDINGNFQGRRVKVVGNPGGQKMSKFEGKARISRLMKKSGKFQGHHKIDWKCREST